MSRNVSIYATSSNALSSAKVSATHTLLERELMSADSTCYYGNFLLENGGLKQYSFAGGYITGGGSKAHCHYYIRDHQGNNRVVVSDGGVMEQTTHYYPYGGIMSQSTGQGVQKYKYNAKELDRTHGLDWYDYVARQYDPAIARFTSMDPLCEKYYSISPYAYCAGDPVNRIDPTGMDWVEDVSGNIMWRESVVSSNYQDALKEGEIYRGVDYVRYDNCNDSQTVGLVQEHYLPNQTIKYEVHNGTFQFDFEGDVVSSQELTGKQLGSNHAEKGIRGTAYLNAVFSDGGTYTTDTYAFTSGPYGNGPTPNHNYTGYDFSYTDQNGMKIYGNMGWKVYMEDYNGRTSLRMHPDTNSPGTAGCIGIQGTSEQLEKLGGFLYDYIIVQKKTIPINFIIKDNPNYGNNGKANPYLGQ